MSVPFPGELARRYRLRHALGSGSFGAVFLADDQELARPVAVKVLTEELADPDQRARFDREARVTASLEHPAIVRVFDHGVTAGGTAFIVYEYVEGEDMAALLARGEAPPVETLVRWGALVADALACAHAAGVVHRDVKPGNVMLRGGQAPVLCDFGLARREQGVTVQTAAGLILGTPAYLAPEVWDGAEASPASDQFAWAASLYRLRFGRPVYPSADDLEVVIDFLYSGRWIALPPEAAGPFDRALHRALARDPAARHPDMHAFAAALSADDLGESSSAHTMVGAPAAHEAALADATLLEAAPARPEPAPRPAGSRPRGAGLLAIVAGAVALLLGFLASPRPPAPPSAPPGNRPEDRPVPPALARARENLARVLGEDDFPRFPDSETRRDHIGARLVALGDSRVVLAWARFVEEFATWMRGLPARPTDAELRELRRLQHDMVHVFEDLEVSIELQEKPQLATRYGTTLEVYGRLRAIEAVWRAIRRRGSAIADGYRATYPEMPDHELLVHAALARYARAEALPDAVRALVARVRAPRPPAERAHLYHYLYASIGHTAARETLPCEVVVGALTHAAAALSSPEPGMEPATVARLQADTVNRLSVALQRCAGGAGAGLLPALGALLRKLAARRRDVDPRGILVQLRAALRNLEALAAPPAGSLARIERLRELVDRFERLPVPAGPGSGVPDPE